MVHVPISTIDRRKRRTVTNKRTKQTDMRYGASPWTEQKQVMYTHRWRPESYCKLHGIDIVEFRAVRTGDVNYVGDQYPIASTAIFVA